MRDGAGTRQLGLMANFAAKTAKRIINTGVYNKMNPAHFHTNWAVSVSMSLKA
jgi:hypothetical protein